MSGIVAMYRADRRPVDPALLRRMSQAMAHRGPDGEGQWVSGPVGLGHRLLCTTPESLNEKQPVTDERGECWLVWDGRLDNREELLAALRTEGRLLGGQTDPELVLGAYRQWGVECLTRIIGEFAFALWDGQTRNLFCARDRLGLKPLHYTWDGVTLLSSSEIKPLLEAHGTTPEPDDEMVLAFLLKEFREEDQGRTFFQGIHRLPPGHYLLIQEGRLRVERYWAIDPTRETRYPRDEEYTEHFLSLFKDAVKCRARSYFPLGALLSGGLDSSAIVCTAGRLFSERAGGFPSLETFTLYSDHPGSDERRYAQEANRATGFKGHEIYGSDPDPLYRLNEVIWHVESPIVSEDSQSTLALIEAIRAWGCRVVLSGDGGDQLLDEYGYLADLLSTMRPLRFTREVRAFAGWYGGKPWEFAWLALATILPPGVKFWGKRIAQRAPPPWISSQLAREVKLRERMREPRHRLHFPSFCKAASYFWTTNPYFLLKLEVEERYFAWHGTEIRYPFLDSRLVEFILSIPPARRTHNGERKRVLRAAMQGIVPEAIRLRRGKGDWSDSMDQSLIALCRLNPPVPLENRSGRMGRYFNLRRAEDLVDRYVGGARNLRWEVWSLITVDRWIEKFWGGAHNE